MDSSSQVFFQDLINSPKLKQREDLAHSFVVLGISNSKINDFKTNSFSPVILDHCPQIYEKDDQLKEDFLYLQSIASICFISELEK